jgi:hypothetical protein
MIELLKTAVPNRAQGGVASASLKKQDQFFLLKEA